MPVCSGTTPCPGGGNGNEPVGEEIVVGDVVDVVGEMGFVGEVGDRRSESCSAWV